MKANRGRNPGREKEVFGVAREPSRFGWNVSIVRSTLASGLTYNTSTVSREYSVEKWNSPAPFASFCLTIPNCLNFSLCHASKVKSPPIRWKRPSNIVPPPTTPTSLSFTRPPCVVQMFLWNRIFFIVSVLTSDTRRMKEEYTSCILGLSLSCHFVEEKEQMTFVKEESRGDNLTKANEREDLKNKKYLFVWY